MTVKGKLSGSVVESVTKLALDNLAVSTNSPIHQSVQPQADRPRLLLAGGCPPSFYPIPIPQESLAQRQALIALLDRRPRPRRQIKGQARRSCGQRQGQSQWTLNHTDRQPTTRTGHHLNRGRGSGHGGFLPGQARGRLGEDRGRQLGRRAEGTQGKGQEGPGDLEAGRHFWGGHAGQGRGKAEGRRRGRGSNLRNEGRSGRELEGIPTPTAGRLR